MKKKYLGLSIDLDSLNSKEELSQKLCLLLSGIALVFGIWGMGREVFTLEVLWSAVLALGLVILPDRSGKWVLPFTVGGAAVFAVFTVICFADISNALGTVCNRMVTVLMEKTGYYCQRFETEGMTFSGAVFIGFVLGTLTAFAVRSGNPLVVVGMTFLVLSLCVIGFFSVDVWIGGYLVGVILYLSYSACGSGKPYAFCAGLMVVIYSVAFVFGGYETVESREKELEDKLHDWIYESDTNPLPEGELSSLGRWAPGTDGALEVTMDHWQGVYLRGFTGSVYTGSGWEEEDTAVLAAHGDFLYTLQKNYFHPYEQMAVASSVLDEAECTEISVAVKNACKVYSYLPYGISGVGLDFKDLTDPSVSSYSGKLYDIADSYLIQKALSDGEGEPGYLAAEAAYRKFVNSRYLELPGEVGELLKRELGEADPALTTTEIKEVVHDWVQRTLHYDEYASTRAGSQDLANYLVDTSPYGYSVHYATLSTLAMRYMGLPARYVEGYVVKRSDASALGAGETLVISQEKAHAWTEYYLDGVGWVPFDVTPGFENELIYHLPPDGTGMQNRPPQEETEPTQPDEPPVKQDPDPSSQTRQHAVRLIYHSLLAVLFVALLGMTLRIILLRRKLKQRLERFRNEKSKDAMLDCIDYQFELLALLGLENRNVPLSVQAKDISQLLFGDDVSAFVQTIQELKFSDHPVREDQRDQILSELDRVFHVWQKVTPKAKKLRTKWLQCKVL